MEVRKVGDRLLVNGKESRIKPSAVQVEIDGQAVTNWVFASDATNQAHLTIEQPVGGGKTRSLTYPAGQLRTTVRPGRVVITLPTTY